MSKRPEHQHLTYRCFAAYVKFFFRLYFPKLHCSGRENVPAEGTPNLMVGCHQNTFIDPLAPSLLLDDRRTRGLIRSDVFKIPVIGWLLHKLGLLPIARMGFEGEAAMQRFNTTSTNQAAQALAEGHTLIMFPESGHQQGRYLGYFSLFYVRLAFQAAARLGYERDVVITPYAHHYANYYHPFYDMMVMFGKPISLKPYYERYQTQPRTVQREVNALVEGQIAELMLNITDRERYAGIDYLRQSRWGADRCHDHGGAPDVLPQRLASDKRLVSEIDAARSSDPAHVNVLLDEAGEVAQAMRQAGLRDWLFDVSHHTLRLIAGLTLALLLLPLAAVSWVLTWPVYLLPWWVKTRRINGMVDPMFSSTADFVGTIVFTFPLVVVLPAVVLALTVSWWFLLYPLAGVAMILLCCRYQRLCVKVWGLVNWCWRRRGTARQLAARRKRLFAAMTAALQQQGTASHHKMAV